MPPNILRRISQRINSSRGSSEKLFNRAMTYHDAQEESRFSRPIDGELSQDGVALLSASQVHTPETNAPHHPIPILQGPYLSHTKQHKYPASTMSGYTTADDDTPADEHSPLRRFNPHRPMHPSTDSGVGISESFPFEKLSRTEIDTFSRIAAGDDIYPNMMSSFMPTTGLRSAYPVHSYFSTFDAENPGANGENTSLPLHRRSSSIHRLQARSSDSLRQIGNGIDTDDLFHATEGANNRTVGLILEGHLEKILRANSNPQIGNVPARRTVCVVRDSFELARVRRSTAMVDGVAENRKRFRSLTRRWRETVRRRFLVNSEERRNQ